MTPELRRILERLLERDEHCRNGALCDESERSSYDGENIRPEQSHELKTILADIRRLVRVE